MIEVRRVQSKADHKIFFEFPWRVYKDNPYWVPPLKSTRRHMLDQERDHSWEYMDGEYFIAWKDGQPVGIVAAFINHRHNETWNEHIGWFGNLEFVDDPEVSAALMTAAEDYVRGKGYDAIRGPANFTFHAEVGMLLDHFDRSPVILMPYNHAYYPNHMENLGYQKVKDLVTWHATAEEMDSEDGLSHRYERIKRVAERVMKRQNITVRPGSARTKKQDFEIIYDLYNNAWRDNWGFVPLTDRELKGLVKELQQVYEPNMAVYAFVGDDPAGFFVAVPDLNQAFHRAYPRPGVPEIFSLLQILWHWKIRPKIDTVRLPLGGIKPKYRGTGVIMAIALAFFDLFRASGWAHFDGGWVLEDNKEMNDVLIQTRANPDRHYRIYQKSLK